MAKFPKFNKSLDFFSDSNLKKYDNIINVLLVVLSVIVIFMLIDVVMKRQRTPSRLQQEGFSSCKMQQQQQDKDDKPSSVKSNKPKMVFYYADWCGHCTHTKPEWKKLEDAYENDNNVSIEKVNEQNMSNEDKRKLKIEGYPTIILFVNGKAIPYEGARSVSNFESFIKKHV